MEKGKFYKSEEVGLIVMCLKKESESNEFYGIVIYSESEKYIAGYESYGWNASTFEPYEPIFKIVNGGTYDIPEGCIATVKDNKLTIENEVKYYYELFSDHTAYVKVDGDRSIVIKAYFDNKDTNSISFEKGIKNNFYKKPLNSDKFLEMYSKYAPKELSL